MMWRLILVVSITALLIAVAMHFSDQLFALLQQAWSLDKDEREKLKDWRELFVGGFGALGALGLFVLAVWKFIIGEKKTGMPSRGSSAVFHDKVKIGGDFVQGNKTKIGGDDA